MKLPNFKRLTTNDFEEQDKKFVEQLGFCMNDGFQNLYDALNKKLTIDDNFLGALKDVDVRVDANGTPLVSTFVNTGISVVPKAIMVVKADNQTNSNVYPTATPWITWNATTTGIQIVNVAGIPANNTFKLRILILG